MYGMFKDYDDYQKNLNGWFKEAEEANEENLDGFQTDIANAIEDIVDGYAMNCGCRYSKKDILDAIRTMYNDPDEYDLADLID